MADLSPTELEARRDEFLLPVGAVVGRLMFGIACPSTAQLIVEFGASFGYSTIWLAAAARETGGTVVSLELAANKVDYGRASPARRARGSRDVEVYRARVRRERDLESVLLPSGIELTRKTG